MRNTRHFHDAAGLEEYKVIWRRYNSEAQDDSVLFFSRQVLSEAMENHDTLTALYSGVYMAQAWLFKEQTDSVLNALTMMEPYIGSQKDNSLKYLYWSIYGGYALKTDLDYTKALEYYNRSYEYAVASGCPGNQLRILLDIIYMFYIRNDANGMRYAREAYSIAASDGISLEDRCTVEIMMAMMSFLQGDDDSAMQYVVRAEKIARDAGLEPLYPLIFKIKGDLCSRISDWSGAGRYYDNALRYSGYADVGIETMIYLDYGRMLQHAGQYVKAGDVLSKGLSISYESNNHECRKDLLSSLIDNSLLMNDGSAVASWVGIYRQYLDSVSNFQREKEFNVMLMSMQKVEYENRAQAAELNYLRSRQRMMANIMVLSVVVIVFLFMVILYRRQRNTYKLLVEKYQNYAEQFRKDSEKAVQDTDQEIFHKVEKLMREDKIYRMKSLTRDSLADMLGTNRTYLSRAINNVSGKSFSDYVNTWRIIEATQVMADLSKDVPLKQLADDLGYNSTAVFYRCFQKETGVTAGKYMREVRSMHRDVTTYRQIDKSA